VAIPSSINSVQLLPADRSESVPTKPFAPHPPTPGRYGNSEAYERYMGRWSRLLAQKFLGFIALESVNSVLDVGAGTGALTTVLAKDTDIPRIVGIDPIEAFVHAARRDSGDRRLRFDVGHAGDLPYPDDAFDATLAQLSFHHFPDPDAALRQMQRVTRSGGLVAACDWDAGPSMELFYVLWDTLAEIYPPALDAKNLRSYAGPGRLQNHWRAAGLKHIEETALVVPLAFADFDDFWTPFVGSPSSVLVQLARLSPALRRNFRAALKKRLLSGKNEGPFTLHARAWAVRGTVP